MGCRRAPVAVLGLHHIMCHCSPGTSNSRNRKAILLREAVPLQMCFLMLKAYLPFSERQLDQCVGEGLTRVDSIELFAYLRIDLFEK